MLAQSRFSRYRTSPVTRPLWQLKFCNHTRFQVVLLRKVSGMRYLFPLCYQLLSQDVQWSCFGYASLVFLLHFYSLLWTRVALKFISELEFKIMWSPVLVFRSLLVTENTPSHGEFYSRELISSFGEQSAINGCICMNLRECFWCQVLLLFTAISLTKLLVEKTCGRLTSMTMPAKINRNTKQPMSYPWGAARIGGFPQLNKYLTSFIFSFTVITLCGRSAPHLVSLRWEHKSPHPYTHHTRICAWWVSSLTLGSVWRLRRGNSVVLIGSLIVDDMSVEYKRGASRGAVDRCFPYLHWAHVCRGGCGVASAAWQHLWICCGWSKADDVSDSRYIRYCYPQKVTPGPRLQR